MKLLRAAGYVGVIILIPIVGTVVVLPFLAFYLAVMSFCGCGPPELGVCN